MDPLHELDLLFRSRHPLLVVDTYEEDRLEGVLREAAGRTRLPVSVWSATTGLRGDGARSRLADSKDPLRALQSLPDDDGDGVWLFKDLHHHLGRTDVVRQLRDLCRLREGQRRTIVLAGPKIEVPPDLEKTTVRFDLGPPTEIELRRLVHQVVRDLGARQPVRVDLSTEDYQRLVESLKGLTLMEAERALARAVVDDDALTAADLEGVRSLKRELLKDQGVLEYLPARKEDRRIGGLGSFRVWLDKRAKGLTPEAEAFGLPAPKGVVLLGVQGCGKTMAARLVAALWDLPLLKLEPGRLFDKFVGESEKNLDQALKLAEHLAPAVLLIDEIEKGFASAGSASFDGGLSRRLLGRLLGWLQDRKAAVFVVATCNDVEELPPELLRKGRFDEVFFVDLPTGEERREILALHLERRERLPATFDLDLLSMASDGFSGAELEEAVVSGLYAAFSAGDALDTAVLEREIHATRPLSVLRREAIEALRDWARERAVPAR